MAKYLLHGTLLVHIHDAVNLQNLERRSGRAPAFLRKLIETSEEVIRMGKGQSQYYATVDLGATRVGRTRVLEGEPKYPVWNETFRIYCAHEVSQVVVSIKDAAIVGTTVVGRVKLPVVDLRSGKKIEGSFPLVNDHTGEIKDARIRFSLEFFDAERDPHWGRGVLDSRNAGIPNCYFPQRKGCRVTLYQDAHMADNFLPPIYLSHDQVYQPTRCWEDVFEAIYNAQKLIYITGWSVYTEIKLVRDTERKVPGDEGLTLGELLKRKADEGVRVNVMVWDDRSSFWLRQVGVMSTHDEETALYFKGTKVNCFLCPRDADANLTLLQKSQIGGLFTHHQKSVIVDAPLLSDPYSARRRIVSFVGGLDLCDGRYDNQFHSLFRTLDKAHATDFHQVFPAGSAETGGPREPWHDIHSKLEGVVAWDVLHNFEERWLKQAGSSRAADLQDIKELNFFPEAVTDEEDPETWNVQLFRSIDAGAAFGFPDNPDEAAERGLISGKDITIDRSIQHAYINAIRRAKNFIYIENQYFLGSSFAWESKQEAGAYNLIPMELVLKIVSKIRAGERFTVYIVVPLYPEGIPESQSVQAILDWQRRTFEMMYKEIALELSRMRLYDQHPREYLTVFFLGNREIRRADEYLPPKPVPDEPYYKSAQEMRRFMIYVHSKMMIVDDEYIIVGSANINERSMHGARDSEIAMGSYQPHHLSTNGSAAGQVHGFRMALWYEHFGNLKNCFLQPWSVECIRTLNERADQLWELWSQDEIVDLPGHLLAYPYNIGQDGSVTVKPGFEFIPDTKAKVLGTTSYALPEILTT